MTAPAHPDRQGTREELAAALHPLVYGGSIDFRDAGHVLDALLPVVERLCRGAATTARADALRPVRALADELDALSDEHYNAYKHGDPRDARRASSYTEGFSVGLDHAAERIRAVMGED